MNPGDDDRGPFWRNVILIAAAHLLIIGGLVAFSYWKSHADSGDNIEWLDGGGMPAGGQDSQPTTPAADDTPQPDETPEATPPPPPEQASTPQENEASSQIVIPNPSVRPTLEALPPPTPTPLPTFTPRQPTPEPTPRPTPKPTPKATPKPKPKSSPKPKPKASPSPKKHPSPKPSPHKTPSDDTNADHDNTDDHADHEAAAKKAAFKKSAGETAGGDTGEEGTAAGTGGGNRGGAGHAGGGNHQGDFGAYNAHLRDLFTGSWDQPTSLVSSNSKYSAIVKIRIEKDGTISDVSLDTPSGNDVMDQSVMAAARKVTHVDPLPDGLGDGGAYVVRINFELTQQSQ